MYVRDLDVYNKICKPTTGRLQYNNIICPRIYVYDIIKMYMRTKEGRANFKSDINHNNALQIVAF